MKLIDLLKTDEVTISCELFPPKQGAQLENYKKIVKEMAALKPAYMSVPMVPQAALPITPLSLPTRSTTTEYRRSHI